MVTGVLKESLGIPEADRGQCLAQCLEQGLASPGAGPAYDLLDLREGLLDGIEVRGVAGQVQQLQASSLYELPDPIRLVRRQAVHDHLTLSQLGKENLL